MTISGKANDLTISVSSGRLAFLFSSVAGFLVLVYVVLQSVRFWLGDHFLMGLLAAFSLGAENNLPTCFSTLALFLCSALLAAIATGEARRSGYRPFYWYALSGMFLFLSMDEMMSIHERLTDPLNSLISESEVFHYAWVLPYGVLVVIVASVFVRFLLYLPRRTALFFIISGALYVAGALGFEKLSGYHSSGFGNLNITYVALQTIEEVLEISGTILFLYALADYSERRFDTMGFCLMRDAAAH